MTAKTKPKDNKAIKVRLEKDQDHKEALARLILRPSVQAAVTIQQWENQSDASLLMNEFQHKLI